MRHEPRISLTILGESWYDHLTLIGPVVDIYDDVGLADLDRLSMRYYGEPYPKRELRCVSAIVRVEQWHSWGDPGARR